MTRFARARGSKASNERTPEESTPWEVMKDQLLQSKKDNEDSKKRQEAEQKRIENYENFLKEQKVQKRKATWCDFPEDEQRKKSVSLNSEPPKKKKNKSKKSVGANVDKNAVNMENSNTNIKTTKSKSKKKNKKSQDETVSQDINDASAAIESVQSKKKTKKPQDDTVSQDIINASAAIESVQSKKKNKKKNKIKKLQVHDTSLNLQSDNTAHVVEENNQNTIESKPPNKNANKKNKNLVDGKPARRKEINDRSFQLIINGKDIELVRFDGFPVMKKDAERLEELQSSMIKKGIPKSEVQRTIKLERRRAEKALARVKREVCYNCRKGGHVLSDCPELKSKIPGADRADGICFKCGSTEHRQFECKVQRDKEFRFASCFICKESGHIARQCPDNPKGLYPNGGNCKLCGDVTHLRKDCPTVMDKKEGSSAKLQTLYSGDNIEDVGSQSNTIVTPTETTKKPKKIKF